MSRLLRSFAFVHLFLFSTLSFANFPGMTPGSFTVTDSGAANYTLPIETPAGVGGMSPDLAITYNSSGGNGLMGVGFQLSGFTSTIHRCGGSHATDGKASGVTYTDSDKLCLDGQRLILIKGTPFTDTAEYRTEIDSFSRIVYQNGSFRINSRDGELTVYGWKVQYDGAVMRWLRSTVHDRNNNIIHYSYRSITDPNDPTSVERWIPKEVRWTDKGATEPGNRKAVISYKARQDKRISYEYGLQYAHNNAIDKITTYIGSTKIKQYNFFYELSPVSGLTRLTHVQQCGSLGGCLPYKNEFQWDDTARGFISNSAYKLPVRMYDYYDIRQNDSCGNNACNDGYSVEVKRGDFIDLNNDGFVDYVESYRSEDSSDHRRRIYKNDRSKFALLTGTEIPVTVRDYYINKSKSSAKGEMLESSTYADVDGDGFVDIVTAYRNDSNTLVKEVRINKRDFTFKEPSQTQYVPPTHMWQYDDNDVGKGKQLREAYLIDVNGDGLLDWVRSLYFPRAGDWHETYINTGTKWEHDPDYDFPQGAIINDYRKDHKMKGTPVQRTELVDLNGDGLIDLIQALKSPDQGSYKNEVHRNVWLNTGSGWEPNSSYKLPTDEYISDYTRHDTDIRLYNNPVPGTDLLTRRGDFIDVNGDGLTDWVVSYRDAQNGNHRKTYLNTGNGWKEDADYVLIGEVIRNYDKHLNGDPGGPESGSFFDINRDGLVDWVVAHNNRNNVSVKKTYLNTGSGWASHNSNFTFPNVLVDNVINEGNLPEQFGGVMDVNGDGAMDYLMSTKRINNTHIVKTYLGNSKPADMIKKIIGPLNAETEITYKPLTDPTVYSNLLADSAYTMRKLKVNGPRPLVSDTAQGNGVSANGRHRLKYHYFQALSDGKRGYSGFAQRRVWDSQQKIQTTKEFYQEFPATGMTRREFTYRSDSINSNGVLPGSAELLSYQINFLRYSSDLVAQGSVLNIDRLPTHASGKSTYAPKFKRTVNTEYELGQGQVRSTWTQTAYDSFSNPTQIYAATLPFYRTFESIDLVNVFSKLTVTQYTNNQSEWLIGMPTRVAVRHRAPGKDDKVRTTETVYNNLGQPRWVTVEPDKPEYTFTTRNEFDDKYGNQISTYVFKTGVGGRLSSVDYDNKGLHVELKTNAEDHTLTIVADPKCDVPKSTTDANGLVTTMIYDEHCRINRTIYPDGTWTKTIYDHVPGVYNGSTVISQPQLKIIQEAKDQPTVITYYDQLGRDIRVEAEGFDGRTVITEKRYNAQGKVSRESLPYYSGGTKYWTKYYYDAIGRLERTVGPDNSESTIDYNGLSTTTTNPKGQTQTKITDLLGRVKTVIDAHGEQLTFTYDAVGNLRTTTDPKGNIVEMRYDDLGRKVWMNDPNMGIWTYKYDFYGQLYEQTDAKGQVITSEFDKLGRLTKRITPDGTSTWVYDKAANGIGKLDRTMNASSYTRVHQYDSLSRPTITQETVQNVTTTSVNTYDSNGRLKTMRYPGRPNAIQFNYHPSLGYLTQIVDNEDNQILWAIDDMDAKGNVTQEHYANGVNITRNYHPSRHYLRRVDSLIGSTLIQDLDYDMDSIGNLLSRRDGLTGTKETFSYDDLNRLTSTLHRPGSSLGTPEYTLTYDYDELGNMIYRSDVGIMNYNQNGVRPHALASVQENSSVIVPENVYNPRDNYSYDTNGNLIENGPRKISWMSYNKPRKMETTVDTTTRKIFYYYGTDFQRIRKYDQSQGKTTRYFGGGSVERISQGANIDWKYYIPVGAATLELKYKQTGSNSSPTLTRNQKHYLFKDHIGSTDVIVDNAGNIVERLSFTPWGERRNADWSESNTEVTSTSTTGFTGHEMDDEIGVVNMNARIYDPVIGRFLSPDAIIPNPYDLQSYNRYSYVNNNPLSFTDPTGHSPVPGGGRYSYENGSFYQTKSVRYCPTSDCGRGDWAWKNVKTKVTDAGMIRHLQIRIGVYSDIVENYGGVSRGNTKETRNNYNRLAAQELAANGNTALYQSYLDKAYAAQVLYRHLKRQSRKRYTKIGIQLAFTAVTAGAGSALTSTQAAALQGTTSFVFSGGDLRAALVGAASAGAYSNIGQGIVDGTISSVQAIAAHGLVGGIASEIQGGGFVQGFVGSSVGKAITVGSSGFFDAPQGTFDAGHFTVSVGGAALAAELAGGDPAMAALQAAAGYAYNHVTAHELEGREIAPCDFQCAKDAATFVGTGVGVGAGAKLIYNSGGKHVIKHPGAFIHGISDGYNGGYTSDSGGYKGTHGKAYSLGNTLGGIANAIQSFFD